MSKNLSVCFTCTQGIDAFKSVLLSNKSEQVILNKIEAACRNVSLIYDSCKRISTEFLLFVYDNAQAVTSEQICAIIGFCPNSPVIDMCNICVKIFAEVKTTMLLNEVISRFYEEALALCDRGPIFRLICRPVVHDVFLSLVASFAKHFVPQDLCQRAQLCPLTYY